MLSHTNIIKRTLACIVLLLFQNTFSNAQTFDIAVKNAFIITRMAEKFHVNPRPLNDEFSLNVFDQLLKQLDEEKIFLTAEDIKALAKYKFDIDDQVKKKLPTFLSAITTIFSKRISSADTIISTICKVPFNFSLPEKITAIEDTSYPPDEKAMRTKLYKTLKAYALDFILDDEKVMRLNGKALKKEIDSLEPVARHKAEQAFTHSINIISQGAGGVSQNIGDEYCKAIALCYDPHTEYFPLSEKEDFESQIGAQHMAFGFNCKEEDGGSVAIENIVPGSPAFKSGQINKGDKILSIQWEDRQPIDVSTGGLRQLYEVLEMSNHDKATLKIKKLDGTERLVVLFKEKMEETDGENKVKSFLLKGNKTIGFISLPSFYQDWENENNGANGCANDVAKEILKLKKENIEGLIIDLRYNGGGSMQEAIELSGIFIDAGPVGLEKEKGAKMVTLKDVNRGTIYDGPLILMVNGYSASASEVVAGTLQDYHRAVIVGAPTYGKATAQIVLPLDTTVDLQKDISAIKTWSYFKVTVSQLYRVNGSTAQAKGVQPDIVLPDVLEANPQRESDNPHVLISPPVESNKYFKPNTIINIDNLKVLAKQKTDSSAYFRALKKYIEIEKVANQTKEVNLKLSDRIEIEKSAIQENVDTSLLAVAKSPYSVDNNLFEKKQLAVDESLKEINDQWSKYLSRDPYLQIAYDIILLMIK